MSTSDRLTRREILELAGAGGLAAGLGAGLPRAFAQEPKPGTPARDGQPKNVIFMIADGMSLAGPSLLDEFAQLECVVH